MAKGVGLLGLRPYQKEVFRDHTSGIVVLHWSRQIGKSYVLAAWAVYRLMTKPGRLVTVLSNSKENGAEFLLKCSEVCRLYGTRFETVVKTPGLDFEDMRMELRIPNKGKVGRIKVLAANPRTARGFSGDLILDEFAFHEDGNKIWEAAEPILASNKDFLCRIASTGNGKRNLFYRIVEGVPLTTDAHGCTRMGKGEGECPRSKVQGPKSEDLELEYEIPVWENPTWTKIPEVVAGMIVDGVPYVPGSFSAEQVQGLSSAELGKGAEECPKSKVQGPKSEELGTVVDGMAYLPGQATVLTGTVQERCGTAKREDRGLRMEDSGKHRCGKAENIEHPTSNTEHEPRHPMSGRVAEGVESRTRTRTRTKPELEAGDAPAERLYGAYYSVSKAGFKVSRVTRTMAHEMGVEIYDSQTREPITPEQARAQALDKTAYDQNYECSFADESLALLSHELITAAESDEEGVAQICEQEWTDEALEEMRQAKGALYAGLDVGRKVDLSVLTVLERVSGVFYVRGMLRMRNMRLPEQELRLTELCGCRQVKQVCIDMTGLGLGLFEYAQRTMGEHMISGINFSSSVSATKVIREEGTNRPTVRVTEAMAMEVLRVYEDRRIRQPRDWQLREDLRRPGKVTTPAGRVSIAATRDGAGHADHFWSLALALEAAGGSVAVPFAWRTVRKRGLGILI